MAHILLLSIIKERKERIMKSRDIKKAVESLQQFLLDEYGLDTKASSSKAADKPTQAQLNAIFGRKYLNANYDKSHKVGNRS
jgi:hypothetical protein